MSEEIPKIDSLEGAPQKIRGFCDGEITSLEGSPYNKLDIMNDNNPYSEFVTFDFSKILERLKGKEVVFYDHKLILEDIGLPHVFSTTPIKVIFKPLPNSNDIINHLEHQFTLCEFKEFLDANREPTYTIYYELNGGIVAHIQDCCPQKDEFTFVKILHIIKKNPDGSEEVINKESLK